MKIVSDHIDPHRPISVIPKVVAETARQQCCAKKSPLNALNHSLPLMG